jgi:hypothetical protein
VPDSQQKVLIRRMVCNGRHPIGLIETCGRNPGTGVAPSSADAHCARQIVAGESGCGQCTWSAQRPVAVACAAQATAAAYLREHRAEEPDARQDALLLRASSLKPPPLIERLEKPSWRSDAPVGMQHYAETIETPMEKTIHERRNGVTARPTCKLPCRRWGVEAFAIAQGLRQATLDRGRCVT